MRRVTSIPSRAFLAALAAVAVLSIMDAVMKHLVLAIGIFAVSVWRVVANLAPQLGALPAAARLAEPHDPRIHVSRSVVVTVMAVLFFWGSAECRSPRQLRSPSSRR